MPEKETERRAKKALREGKSPTTAAGEFVHEEIEHVREGKHGARSPEQAIAIGLSKARRAGVPLKPPARGRASKSTRKRARRDYEAGQKRARKSTSRKSASRTKRSQARRNALKREGRSAVSRSALSKHAKRASRKRRS